MMTTPKETERLPFYTLLIFIIAGSIGAGYFHTRSFLTLAAVLYAVTAVHIAVAKKLTLLPVHGFLLLLILLYWLGVANAADHEQAVLEAVKISLLLPVSLLFASLPRERCDQIWAAWAWSGAGLTLWGFAFGLFREGRLESTFGYANVFAVIVAAGIWAGWRAFRISAQKRYLAVCIIQLAGLLTSGSRAVLLLFLVGLGIVVLLERRDKTTAAAVGVMALILTAALVAGVWLKGSVALRELTWNAPEFLLRRVYWADALSLWKKHWLSGIGGGGFAILYPSVYVKYVHQQYLQVALDTGIFGALAFIGMILFSIRAGLRRGRQGWGGILAIVLFCAHLAFDIDLAYPLVFGLFVMLLTGMEKEGYQEKKLQLSRFVSVTLALICIFAVCTLTWMTAGYSLLAKGESAAARQDWNKAAGTLRSAEALLPWSHEVHYKLAAVYSGLAQSEGNETYIKRAIEELKIASSMVPENRRYKEMLKKAE